MSTTTKERPILFSPEMVRAILDGRKTETRRVVKPQPGVEDIDSWSWSDYGHSGAGWYAHVSDYPDEGSEHWRCPYGAPGDALWVRETFAEGARLREGEWSDTIVYRADHLDLDTDGWGWTPSIFMPREHCRLRLEVEDVRVERLHEMRPEDVVSEGFPHPSYAPAFADLWDSINAARGYPWDENPWVWVVRFRKLEATP